MGQDSPIVCLQADGRQADRPRECNGTSWGDRRRGIAAQRVGLLRTPASKTMIIDRKAISIMKACELVGVSRRTIYNWISSGKVEYVRTAGGSIRIFADTLWREPAGASKDPVWAQANRKEA